eukprot:5532339-Prymnesium_polylepis.1
MHETLLHVRTPHRPPHIGNGRHARRIEQGAHSLMTSTRCGRHERRCALKVGSIAVRPCDDEYTKSINVVQLRGEICRAGHAGR